MGWACGTAAALHDSTSAPASTIAVVKLRRRPSVDDRRRLLSVYLAELRTLDWTSLSATAPDESGFWPIDALATRRDDVDIRPSFYVPWSGGDLCVIVDASSSSKIHTLVIDGFALRDGASPEDMTDSEWADLNL